MDISFSCDRRQVWWLILASALMVVGSFFVNWWSEPDSEFSDVTAASLIVPMAGLVSSMGAIGGLIWRRGRLLCLLVCVTGFLFAETVLIAAIDIKEALFRFTDSGPNYGWGSRIAIMGTMIGILTCAATMLTRIYSWVVKR